jgi:hypothetical protein
LAAKKNVDNGHGSTGSVHMGQWAFQLHLGMPCGDEMHCGAMLGAALHNGSFRHLGMKEVTTPPNSASNTD